MSLTVDPTGGPSKGCMDGSLNGHSHGGHFFWLLNPEQYSWFDAKITNSTLKITKSLLEVDYVSALLTLPEIVYLQAH